MSSNLENSGQVSGPVSQMLRKVRVRMLVRQLCSRSFALLIVLAILYAVLLLAGRLTGLFPEYFAPWTVAAVPVLSVLLAVVWPGRPDLKAAASATDGYHQTKDLFLTWSMLSGCPTEYAPLVGRDAERTAFRIEPEKVVPYHWEHPTLTAALTLGALLLGAFFVPTLDPFGHVAEAKEAQESHRVLEQTRKATEARKAQLAQKDIEKENSDEVEKALEGLQTGFQKLKKGEAKQNLKRLNEHQEEIGELYRKLNSGELKSLFDKMEGEQQFGQLHDQEMFRQWQKELQQGSSEKLQQSLEGIKNDLEKLAKTDDPVAKSELERKLQKKMKELSDFASKKAGSQSLNAALQRAMEQMESARKEGMSQEAMKAIQESLAVAQKECQMLAQSARDLQDLEEALQMISMSKQLAADDQLDGEMFDGEMSLEDYAEMYAELMGMSQGNGGDENGNGTGGRGMGEGGVVDEDDDANTDFVDEKSKSAIQKGKILLSMKTKGLSDTGDIKDEDYKRIVGEIRQSLEDVIDQEEIPPGYIDGIKKYFDTLEKTDGK